jgi:hypothetical protein
VDNIAGMEVLEALCNFVKLNLCVNGSPRTFTKAYQFVNIGITMGFEIVHYGTVLHPRGNHAKR